MKRVCVSASVVVAAALLVACNSTKGNPNAPTAPTAPTPPAPTASVRDVVVTSSPASATTYQMTAKADLSDGTSSDVTTASRWDTSDATLATVSASGLLTVLKSGHIYVRATYQNMAGMLDMTINAPAQAGTLALSGVAFEPPPTPKPVAGLTLRIIQGPDTGQSTMTDAAGHFMFPPLHPGEIGVEAVKDGYLPWRLTNLMMDHDRDLQVVLYPTPPVNGAGMSATARCNDASWSWAQTRAEACAANNGIAYTVCPGPLC
jgi:hypothetical protein